MACQQQWSFWATGFHFSSMAVSRSRFCFLIQPDTTQYETFSCLFYNGHFPIYIDFDNIIQPLIYSFLINKTLRRYPNLFTRPIRGTTVTWLNHSGRISWRNHSGITTWENHSWKVDRTYITANVIAVVINNFKFDD